MTLASGRMEIVFVIDMTAAWYVLEEEIGTGIGAVLKLLLLEPD